MALEREFEYYQKNMAEIREKYLGKEVVIVGEQIIAAYDGIEEAYTETVKTYRPKLGFSIANSKNHFFPLRDLISKGFNVKYL